MSCYFFDDGDTKGRLYRLDDNWFLYKETNSVHRAEFQGTAEFFNLTEDEKNRAIKRKK